MTDNPSPSDIRQEDLLFTQYRRTQIAEMVPWSPDLALDLSIVSVSKPDRENGSPKEGDMIARNPKNHADMWLVAAKYYADNFEPRAALSAPVRDACAETGVLPYASPPPQPDTAPSPLSTGEVDKSSDESAGVREKLEYLHAFILRNAFTAYRSGKSAEQFETHLVKLFSRIIALSQPPATEQIRREVLVKALEEIEDLGANGATAARLGNIAHAALIVVRAKSALLQTESKA